jgi:predicted ABC-type ATPase
VEPRPSVVILAGPNGAGKSTAAHRLLQGVLAIADFVNADDIALELSPADPESAALSAGREMLSRLHDLARQRRSFAFETTLASRHFAGWLQRLLDTGYAVHVLFLWLPGPDVARARVERRVMAGGHDVPEASVRRRYTRGLRNFFTLYQPLATTWEVYDSSVSDAPLLIAAGSGRTIVDVADPVTWARVQRGAYGNE